MYRKLLSMLRKQKRLLVWISIVASGALAPAMLFLVSGHSLVWRDTSKLFQPVRSLVVEALQQFQLPLWNPYEALGIPLFAQMMHGVLHPVSVLGAFFFPHAGMDVFILIYVMMAAVGNAILSRTLGVSFGSAALAGLGYGLSGYVLGMGSIIQYLSAAATAPWCVAGIRMAGEGRRHGIVAAAAATAAMHFAGDPQWTIIAILLGSAMALEAGNIRGFKTALLGIIIGTALAGIQLLPTMAYLGETSRGVELNLLDRMQWDLSPWRLIEFIAPGFFGSSSAGLEKWPVFMWLGGLIQSGFEMPFVPSVYVGSCILVLAAAGGAHSRLTRGLVAASLVLLWLALGTNAGAEHFTHFIPVWGKFRYAEKMVGPLTLCLSLLAAFGSERISKKPSGGWLVLAGGAGTVFIIMALSLRYWPGLDALFTDAVKSEAARQARYNLSTGFVHTGITLLSLAGLIAFTRRSVRFRSCFPVAAAALVFLQLSLASQFALHAGASNIRDDYPFPELRNAGEHTRILTPLESNFLYPKELDDYDGQIAVQSHLGMPSYNVPSHIDQFSTYTGLIPRRYDTLTRAFSQKFGAQSAIVLRRFAVTHMIIKNPYNAGETEIARVASTGGNKILVGDQWNFLGWSVPHRPWAFFAEKVALVPGEKEALASLAKILEQGDSTVVVEGTDSPGSPGTGRIIGFERKSNYLRIEATSAGNGVLVVNDSYWPGWMAKIDGKEVPVWPADYLVRAVPWPSGRHVLEMRYEPKEVRAGLFVSMAGAVALIGLVVGERRRLRKSLL